MHEQWMLAMLVLHVLFHPELTESSVCESEKNCGCLKKEGNMQIKRGYENTTAIIPCPHLERNEELIAASLHKGKTELHYTDMTNKSQTSSEKFKVSIQNYSVSYMIQSTISNDTGIYSCEIQTKNERRKTTNTTILLIKDAQQSTNSPEPDLCLLNKILYSVCGVIILYDLIVTVIVCVLVYKFKTIKPPENTYMNTRRGRYRRP